MNNHNNTCNSIMLTNLSNEELSACFNSVREEISCLRCDIGKQERKEYLTRQEVIEMLKCNASTIYHWCNEGILKPYMLGGRVYFRLSEIEAAMIPVRRKPKN